MLILNKRFIPVSVAEVTSLRFFFVNIIIARSTYKYPRQAIEN